MKRLFLFFFAAFLVLWNQAYGQIFPSSDNDEGRKPKEPLTSGAIIMPGTSDHGIEKTPPESSDSHSAHQPPAQTDTGILNTPSTSPGSSPHNVQPKKKFSPRENRNVNKTARDKIAPGRSTQDSCRGSATDCKQSSGR
ncbi:MAG TPA: hypothetical protein VEC35_20990 [Noviherbaspirillum sp.]|nr:hypothetical protein [Noviherbaspirillum sp.]